MHHWCKLYICIYMVLSYHFKDAFFHRNIYTYTYTHSQRCMYVYGSLTNLSSTNHQYTTRRAKAAAKLVSISQQYTTRPVLVHSLTYKSDAHISSTHPDVLKMLPNLSVYINSTRPYPYQSICAQECDMEVLKLLPNLSTANPRIIDVRYALSTVFSTSLLLGNR